MLHIRKAFQLELRRVNHLAWRSTYGYLTKLIPPTIITENIVHPGKRRFWAEDNKGVPDPVGLAVGVERVLLLVEL
jgi:hypothetical protein